jgi:hypothetical protein
MASVLKNLASCMAKHIQTSGAGRVTSDVVTVFDMSASDISPKGFKGVLFAGFIGAFKPSAVMRSLLYTTALRQFRSQPVPA